ncbi:MAG: DUF4349 domain-containing protein, partial [Chloroflexi bacterium]|nr:DUF4349 domain-containing protein [Chloroflexota bacterium]
ACSSADDETQFARGESADSGGFAGQPGAPGLPALPTPSAMATVVVEMQKTVPVSERSVAASAPEPALADAAPTSPGFGLPSLGGDDAAFDFGESSSTEEQAALVAQQRIIVRTVDMHVVVSDIALALDEIAGLAQELGGWVVSSDRSQKHQGFISVRIPADKLDDGVLRLRQLAFEVDSEVTSSRDVTDEYVDISARLKNFQATEEALLRLMDRATR